MMNTAITPRKDRMYGLTHEPNGTPRVLEPKTVKVGIGLPAGRVIRAYIDQAGKWVVAVGKDLHRFDSMQEARRLYRKEKPVAPERKYPIRLRHFTFGQIGPDGTFEPDWEAIESHGPLPTEIDILFVRDDPFQASYQMWTAAEKKCDGDGINALRVLSLAQSQEEKKLAAAAQAKGEKYFPIVNGCWIRGCPYSKGQGDRPASCRPHGRLLFQLLNSPRLGGTAYFDTSGFRSISQLFSCIQTFRNVTGQGDAARGFVAGIPLKLVLRPYRTSHAGKATTQSGVSLEFRATSAVELKRRLVQHGVDFRLAAAEGLRRLTGAPEVDSVLDESINTLPIAETPEPPIEPAAIMAEFSQAPEEEIRDESEEPDVDNGSDFAPVDPEDPWEEQVRAVAGAAAAGAGEAVSKGENPPPPAPVSTSAPAESSPSAQPAATQPAPARKPNPRWQKFYSLCRSKGMNDRMIYDELGRRGYESPVEIPDTAYPELMQWAHAYKRSQPSLL